MRNEKILIIDDEPSVRRLIWKALQSTGILVYQSDSVEKALDIITRVEFDLFLLDICLEHENDGYHLAQMIREVNPFTPIFFLSGKTSEQEIINGLEVGADQYLTKPFSIKILQKKIALILSREPKNSNIYDDGFLRIDFELGKIQKGKEECPVTPTEYRILKKLIQNKGQLLTYSRLLDSLWDEGVQLLDKHALAVNINRLRKKIETEEHSYISNVYGMGYIWK